MPTAQQTQTFLQMIEYLRQEDIIAFFQKAKIKPGPLTIILDKIPELESLGLKEGVGSQLTVNQTRDLISLIRAHVSFPVGFYTHILLFKLNIAFREGQGVPY